VFVVIVEEPEREFEVRLHWPPADDSPRSLLPARQTQLSPGRPHAQTRAQARAPRKTRRQPRPVANGRRQREVVVSSASPPAVVELARRVQELTNVVADLGARMAAHVDELKQAGGAFAELRQSTDELRVLRDSIESLLTTRNQRQATLESQLELLTDEIRGLRRQVPMNRRGRPEHSLAETISDAVRSAIEPEGDERGRPKRRRR
jgi:hypothetical protein